MTHITKREVDLSAEEREALLFLSRSLSMQNDYATVTYDEDALRAAMAPVAPPVVAPPVPEERILIEQVPAEQEAPVIVPTPVEEAPIEVTSSLPALVSQEVEQDSQPRENDGSEGEGEQHDTVALP